MAHTEYILYHTVLSTIEKSEIKTYIHTDIHIQTNYRKPSARAH